MNINELTKKVEDSDMDELSKARYRFWLEDHNIILELKKEVKALTKSIETIMTNHLQHIDNDIKGLNSAIKKLQESL